MIHDSSQIVFRAMTSTEPFTPQRGDSAHRAFRAAVPPADSAGQCSISRTAGSGATRVVARFQARDSSTTSVTLWFDSAGALVRFTEGRGSRAIRLPTTATTAQRDSALRAGFTSQLLTSISIDFAIDEAMATNRGAGRPTESIMGTARQLENLDALGPPTARIQRVRKLCAV